MTFFNTLKLQIEAQAQASDPVIPVSALLHTSRGGAPQLPSVRGPHRWANCPASKTVRKPRPGSVATGGNGRETGFVDRCSLEGWLGEGC